MSRPERKTAIIARELGRYNIDIAALSETRLADTGELTERGQGYTFFWSGKSEAQRREAGVGFAIRTSLVRKMESLPRGINERLMTMRLPLQRKRYLTLVSAYAPTMTYTVEDKEAFYERLTEAVKTVPPSDRLLVLGDFNARVGSNHKAWEGVLGPHGVGKDNSNGQLLLSFCSQENLSITNSFFQLPEIHKTTWMHPRSKHWHLIDYVITRRKDLRDILITRAMKGADCWTDHALLRSKLAIRVAPLATKQAACIQKKLNTTRLVDPSSKMALSEKLTDSLQAIGSSTDCETRWGHFRDTVYQAAKETLGCYKRKHQDWFDENDSEISALLSEKQKAHQEYLSNPTARSKKQKLESVRRVVQNKIRQVKDTWWADKAKELQSHADAHNTKAFFSGLKEIYGPTAKTAAPVKSTTGALLTEKNDILHRWTEHFDMLLNRPSSVDQSVIDAMEQRPQIDHLAIAPSIEEVKEAIQLLQTGKAPGPDGIPPEVYKEGGPAMLSSLTSLFQLFWEAEELPQDLKDANIVYLYKNKGDKTVCDNYRGISLLSIAGKILAKVVINRRTAHILDDVVSESQCGFRANRGIVDMVFSIRQLQEKCREQQQNLYIIFVDLTKAFDTVSRTGLWSILEKLGCPPKLVSIIRAFHDGMQGRVVASEGVSQPFSVTNGVKQGCVMAPTLFSILFAAMLQSALNDCSAGISIRYRFDGQFYDLRRLRARTKISAALIRDLLYADDCALVALSEGDLQELAERLSTACEKFGLTISLTKTVVMLQPAPLQSPPSPAVAINGTQLKVVKEFTYLGSCLSEMANLDPEINSRLAKASASFGRLWSRVWRERGLSVQTKIQVYNAVVISALLFGCETWTMYRKHLKQLEQFHIRCLRKIMGISWEDHIPNTDILRRSGLYSIEAKIMLSQLRWAGHVVRMSDERLPKQIFFSELEQGVRTSGRPLLRYKDTLKHEMKACNIDPSQWLALATDRSAWRTNVHRGVKQFEARRLTELDHQRTARKARGSQPFDPLTAVVCKVCGRVCRSAFGLRSHMRTH